jgi:HD-like signal output (HDOD) protein
MWRTSGLSDAQRVSLFNSGEIKVVEKGQSLFKKGENGGTAYYVLNGTLAAAGKADGFRFSSADWIVEMDPSTSRRISSVWALTPSKILVIDEAGFKNLAPDVRAKMLAGVAQSNLRRLSGLKRACADAEFRRSKITRHIDAELRQRWEQHEKSELIVNIIKSIPSLPLYTTELIQMLLNEKISTKQAAEAAKRDPSMVSEILKTVNSAAYGLEGKVSDLHYAMMYLGFNEVYKIAMSCGLRKTMPDSEQFRALHLHSLILSHIAFELCQLHDKQNTTIASTTALLHDLGKSVLFLLEKQNPKSAVLIRMLDPSKIGAMLLRQWNIPEIVCQTVELQSHPYFTPPSEVPSEYGRHIAILYLAHAIYDHIGKKHKAKQEHPFLADYMASLNLSQSLDEIANEVKSKSLRAKPQSISSEVRGFFMH